jgi:hypothetical protein
MIVLKKCNREEKLFYITHVLNKDCKQYGLYTIDSFILYKSIDNKFFTEKDLYDFLKKNIMVCVTFRDF